MHLVRKKAAATAAVTTRLCLLNLRSPPEVQDVSQAEMC